MMNKSNEEYTPSISLKDRIVGVLKYHSIKNDKAKLIIEECDFEELSKNLISCFEQFK